MILLNLFGLSLLLVTIALLLIFLARALIAAIMKKPFPKKSLVAALAGAMIVIAIYIFNVYFFTFHRIEKEYMQNGPGPIPSPAEQYIANAYYEPYGGAVGGVNVWIEITDRYGKKKIIYYSDAKQNIDIKWEDDRTLFIQNESPTFPHANHSIVLDVETEIYHDRGLACKSLLMKGKYETCYHNRSEQILKKSLTLLEIAAL